MYTCHKYCYEPSVIAITLPKPIYHTDYEDVYATMVTSLALNVTCKHFSDIR